ncbi:macrolide family glycosyltransferase [Pseudonocardia sp. NPDC046786]|uniref:macrolide family glycosyltransferase n=1 Tax=Pseudonocardia sp. NPDC046786 TaxID=3155471 RepID=UPI0033ED992F
MPQVIMAAMPAWGHINPSAPLVRELTDRGIGVTFYATEQFRPLVESTGAEFRAYPVGAISPEVIAEATGRGGSAKVVQRILEATPILLPFLQSRLREEPTPDAVMFDSNALWGRMLATSIARPAVSLMTTIFVGSSAFRALRARELLPVVRESVAALPGTLNARHRLRRGAGRGLLPPSPMFPTRGDLTIFPIPEWMQPPDDRRDTSCHYAGPSIEHGVRTEETDPELANLLERTNPLVVVSLGTLHAFDEGFFRSCVDAFSSLPANVLLVVGPNTDPARLGPTPSNIIVRSVIPQLKVLRHAAVFVTHGGMNSVLEALHFGVPMVAIPQQVEQLLIGQAIADRGAGHVLRHHLGGRDVPPGKVRTAVESLLLDPSYTTSARSLAATLHTGGGAKLAADRIERLLLGSGAAPNETH